MMARKKRPNIQGTDPNYTTNFASSKEAGRAFTPATPAIAKPMVETDATPASSEPSGQAPQPAVSTATEAVSETPTKIEAAAKPAPKPKKRPEPAAETVPDPDAPDSKRETRLDAAVTEELARKLAALKKHGYATQDVIALAGRRATSRFELKPDFVPKPEADRLPMRQGYHTTKRLSAKILDDLREEHDPLRLQSDSAMIRGQFEPLFWTCLDEVIKELHKKAG